MPKMQQNPLAPAPHVRQLLQPRLHMDASVRQRQTPNLHDNPRRATPIPSPRALHSGYRAAGKWPKVAWHDFRRNRKHPQSRNGFSYRFQGLQHGASVAPVAEVLLQAAMTRPKSASCQNRRTKKKKQEEGFGLNRK